MMVLYVVLIATFFLFFLNKQNMLLIEKERAKVRNHLFIVKIGSKMHE